MMIIISGGSGGKYDSPAVGPHCYALSGGRSLEIASERNNNNNNSSGNNNNKL